jgi:hypothetical protein
LNTDPPAGAISSQSRRAGLRQLMSDAGRRRRATGRSRLRSGDRWRCSSRSRGGSRSGRRRRSRPADDSCSADGDESARSTRRALRNYSASSRTSPEPVRTKPALEPPVGRRARARRCARRSCDGLGSRRPRCLLARRGRNRRWTAGRCVVTSQSGSGVIDAAIASALVFVVMRVLPYGAAILVSSERPASPEPGRRPADSRAAGLDDPLPQYVKWVRGLLTGNPNVAHRARWRHHRQRLPVTLHIRSTRCWSASSSRCRWALAAVRDRGRTTSSARRRSSAWPLSFWIGLLVLLILVLAFAGCRARSINVEDARRPHALISRADPGVAVQLVPARMVRANLLEVLRQDYIPRRRARPATGQCAAPCTPDALPRC